jgi:hypothetical protein
MKPAVSWQVALILAPAALFEKVSVGVGSAGGTGAVSASLDRVSVSLGIEVSMGTSA